MVTVAGVDRSEVERRLIAAFRRLPTYPVFSVNRRLQAASDGQRRDTGVVIEPLAWAVLLDEDPDARKYLWAWARCQATETSFGGLCRAMGWPRSTAEKGRRRAAATLARAL